MRATRATLFLGVFVPSYSVPGVRGTRAKATYLFWIYENLLEEMWHCPKSFNIIMYR